MDWRFLPYVEFDWKHRLSFRNRTGGSQHVPLYEHELGKIITGKQEVRNTTVLQKSKFIWPHHGWVTKHRQTPPQWTTNHWHQLQVHCPHSSSGYAILEQCFLFTQEQRFESCFTWLSNNGRSIYFQIFPRQSLLAIIISTGNMFPTGKRWSLCFAWLQICVAWRS